ncbi:ATP-binding cassette domain-containing protein, partial [Stutzerimonas kunmingensis]
MIECHGLQWGSGRPLTPPLDLQLAAGSLTAVIGSNGSGKSSLLKVIAGLDRPLVGRIELGVP